LTDRSLDVGRDQSYALIDPLSEQMPVDRVCATFDVCRLSYYEYRQHRNGVDVECLALEAQVNRAVMKSQSSAGSWTIKGLLNDEGVVIGRFKVRSLMKELGLTCKQPGPHAYKKATIERPDIPNRLAREFTVDRPDQVWCGDITYIWSGQRWSYLAVVLDLYARHVVVGLCPPVPTQAWRYERWTVPGSKVVSSISMTQGKPHRGRSLTRLSTYR